MDKPTSAPKRESILGMRVDRASAEQALQAMEGFIAARMPRHVVTADASMVVIARQDATLRAIVEKADLVTADGAGILWASRKLLKDPLTDKVSGVDLVAELCRLSAEKGYKLYFLGAAPGVAGEAAAKLAERYPGCQIVGARDGYFRPEEEADVVREVAAAHPDVLLVAFGIPKQEKFIHAHKTEIGAPVSIGIGGSFDVYSGRVQRAPAWMQRNSLEWLYRLLKNPRKIGKVMTLPRFVMMALQEKFGGAG